MSAGHQIKKAREAAILDGWIGGKKRTYKGVTYLTRGECTRARIADKKLSGEGQMSLKKIARRLRMAEQKLLKETQHGRKEEDRAAA